MPMETRSIFKKVYLAAFQLSNLFYILYFICTCIAVCYACKLDNASPTLSLEGTNVFPEFK